MCERDGVYIDSMSPMSQGHWVNISADRLRQYYVSTELLAKPHMQRVDWDCQSRWSACTTACEKAAQRRLVLRIDPVTRRPHARSGHGTACPASARDCKRGEDNCGRARRLSEAAGSEPVSGV